MCAWRLSAATGDGGRVIPKTALHGTVLTSTFEVEGRSTTIQAAGRGYSMTSLGEWNTISARSGRPSSVLGRMIGILDAVKESGGSVSITDLATRTGLPKSTVSRLVAELTGQRYLERTDDGVTLGLRLFEL